MEDLQFSEVVRQGAQTTEPFRPDPVTNEVKLRYSGDIEISFEIPVQRGRSEFIVKIGYRDIDRVLQAITTRYPEKLGVFLDCVEVSRAKLRERNANSITLVSEYLTQEKSPNMKKGFPLRETRSLLGIVKSLLGVIK